MQRLRQNVTPDYQRGYSAGVVAKDPRFGKDYAWVDAVLEEAINTSFCPLQEKSHTFVLRGLRNISEAP